MEIIFLIGGILLGVLLSEIAKRQEKVHGVIEIDHDTEQCRFLITSAELSERKTKTAIFIVKHDAKISREEQGL